MYFGSTRAISRRKTSPPAPGLEWVTSVTTLCGYLAGAAAARLPPIASSAMPSTAFLMDPRIVEFSFGIAGSVGWPP